MKTAEPDIFIISEPSLRWEEMRRYLQMVSGTPWIDGRQDNSSSDAESLVEFMGKMCFDDETEILTTHGWKNGLKLETDDLVLTRNVLTGNPEWQPFLYLEYEYNGRMLSFKQRGLNLVVTPDHRLWAEKMKVNGEFGKAHFVTADTIDLKGAWRMQRNVLPVAGTSLPPDSIDIPSHVYASGENYLINQETPGFSLSTEPYVRFLGYVLSEGFIHRLGTTHYVGITQKKGGIRENIITTIKEIGLPFQIVDDPRKPNIATIRVGGGRKFVSRVHQDVGGDYAAFKRIPRWILDSTDITLPLNLYTTMYEGDGQKKIDAYDTASPGLADDVQELLSRLGIPTSLTSFVAKDRTKMYKVRLLQQKFAITKGKNRKWTKYQGKVWCVSTKNGVVYVRRGGYPVWSGNCYRSWAPGLNPNVKRVREDQKVYMENILRSKHGSVLEHAYFSFIFYGVSRVFTHELVRHRAGVAISQESMRFVRLDDLPFWLPEWAREDEELVENAALLLNNMEMFQGWMAEHFMLDKDDYECPECEGVGAVTEMNVTNVCPRCTGSKRIPLSFHEKKAKTSFMRRFAPDGIATSIGWTANVRTLRHVIEARTAEGAEEEIRLVFDKVAQRMVDEYPLFFGDFVRSSTGEWIPEWSKV